MDVVKRIIADILYRNLGSYVDGLTKESIGNGIWEGNLELRDLTLKAESLAVLFESFGLDLPVTVTAGYVGLLCVEVPWTNLQSKPVRIILTDVAVVASPVSDGEQKDLSTRELRLKTARLATDESVRDVKFSLRSAPSDSNNTPQKDASSSDDSTTPTATEQAPAASRWRFGFSMNWWKKTVMRIVDNIQVEIENVIVQYEDASSVRGQPYTCTLALDSLKASAAGPEWCKVFNNETSPVARKIAQLDGLVLNWEPGIGENELKTWINNPSSSNINNRSRGHWSGYVRSCGRHAIKPMQGELRMSIVRPGALAEALSSTDPTKDWIKRRPIVEMDLHIPDIAVALDDFNYHTLLSTVMYLSDIDRRVRPTTAKGRWQWAVDRLLPRFKERRKAAQILLDWEKLLERREIRERYTKARNSVVTSRRKGARIKFEDLAVVEKIEAQESYEDILLYRDMADKVLFKEAQQSMNSNRSWSFWSSFKRVAPGRFTAQTANDAPGEVTENSIGLDEHEDESDGYDSDASMHSAQDGTSSFDAEAPVSVQSPELAPSRPEERSVGIDSIPRLRMAFLLERGAITLSRGGFSVPADPIANLEFRELRLGITTAAVTGFVLEAVLGAFEAYDLKKQSKFWYARTPRPADSALERQNNDDNDDDREEAVPKKTTDRSYPSDVMAALKSIRNKEGNTNSMSTSSITNLSSSLQYIAALRISEEYMSVNESDEKRGSDTEKQTRLAMDLGIGGMEVILDGPDCAFISAVSFWSPREKLPSIMAFLSRSAAPRLAFLRMQVQKSILEHKEPMRMDLHIRAPRFVVKPAGSNQEELSVIVDLGTFAMETATGNPQMLSLAPSDNTGNSNSELTRHKRSSAKYCELEYTDYRITCSDLGLFLITGQQQKNSTRNTERLVEQFSLNLVVKVLHNPSYVEALTMHLGHVDVSKVKLGLGLSSLSTSISHKAFRQVLSVLKRWNTTSTADEWNEDTPLSVGRCATEDGSMLSAELAEQNHADKYPFSSLISFEMLLELENLNLELRDAALCRIVTISTTGTVSKLRRRPGIIDFAYRVQSFAVVDGSRGATAPHQRLAYAGSDPDVAGVQNTGNNKNPSNARPPADGSGKNNNAFVSVEYSSNLTTLEQTIAVQVLSLHMVCVRETYLALADFFYLVEKTKEEPVERESRAAENAVVVYNQGEYSDPFNALGMTTVSAARKFREKANIGMEMSKQAFANRGKLVVTAVLDGFGVVLVSGEGPIASFEISDCKSQLVQAPGGSVEASGQFGRLEVRDLTAAYEVYSTTVEYHRAPGPDRKIGENAQVDGWTLKIPETGCGNPWFTSSLQNLKVVYLQRFVIILKKYFDVLRENLRPVLEIKGGIAEVFDEDADEDLSTLTPPDRRLRLRCITENIDVIIPRHSQSPHEALRFVVGHSALTNADDPASGYKFGVQVRTTGVKGYVLYDNDGGNRDREATSQFSSRPIQPFASLSELIPFTENGEITAKLDLWRTRRVPQVVVNSEGIPVLKEGEDERKYDPTLWRPTIRVRIYAPGGLNADLCEAQYSILYFCLTENLIERPDIEFTDIVSGLKTPVLPARKPIRPIMLSSHRLPPNYQVLFEVASLTSTIIHGEDPTNEAAKLIRTDLRRISGSFEYGADFRMAVEVSGFLHSLIDIRPHAIRQNATVISCATSKSDPAAPDSTEDYGSITLTWDRPHGYRANVMLVVSDIRVIVVPELFRDLGLLTAPGFPYLNLSAPAPFLRFNGRQLIVTVSRPEIWLGAQQHGATGRSLVIRGDLIAKVQWAAVTGRNTFEVAAHGLNMNLSNKAPVLDSESPLYAYLNENGNGISAGTNDDEIPLLYPSDISLKYQGSGYDPPATPGGEPTKAPGSELTVDAESLLLRVDVNDIPLILEIGSRLARLRTSVLSIRPPQPGRFDEWIDNGEKGDAKLFAVVSVPHARLIFTDEVAGYYIPIMELRVGNAIVRSNIWVTNSKFEFSIDLFNDEKGWWEPGLEPFSFEVAVSRGNKSGSEAVQLRAEQTINANITPTTISGAFRVANTLKHAIEDLLQSLQSKIEDDDSVGIAGVRRSMMDAQRPSVAAFCVKNETGRNIALWLPYDSMKRNLKGSGGELEIAMPTEDLLWSAVSTGSNGGGVDRNRDRLLTMQCTVEMSGYDSVQLSAAEVGSHVVYFFPETTTNNSPARSPDGKRYSMQGNVLTLVWTVSMRNGVPVGCLRSLFRIVNETRTVFGVRVGPISRALSKTNSSPEGQRHNTDEDPVWIKAGESWSVPVYAVEKTISVRPIVLEAPDIDSPEMDEDDNSSGRGRVVYKYHWSDPFSRFSSLLASGLKLEEAIQGDGKDKSKALSLGDLPSLSCRGVRHGNPFTILLVPRVGTSPNLDMFQHRGKAVHWLDIVLRAPFLVSNALPRPVTLAISSTNNNTRPAMNNYNDRNTSFVVKERIESLRTEHVHTAGKDLSRLSVGIGYDNCPVTEDSNSKRISRNIHGVQKDLSIIEGVPVGTPGDGNCKFLAKLDRITTNVSQNLTLYSEFWIRNRSNSELMFKNANRSSELTAELQEILLRSRPPGSLADKYIAFSGPWVAFRLVSNKSDKSPFKPLGVDISEIERPVFFTLNKASLIVEVRPARGGFHRTLIITIRNAVWIENRTDVTLQWCQPAALDSNGNALTVNVHTAMPGTCTPLYWDFEKESKEICIRRAENDNSSDWIWSRPIAVDGIEGDFAAKMYRPRWHEQYIARIAVTKLPGGVGAVVIHREDRSTPPYRIMNQCKNRSIAFRQNGVQEKSPWLIRPGKSTRYSWDNPSTQLRRRCLVVEVIEVKQSTPKKGKKSPGMARSMSTGTIDPQLTDGGGILDVNGKNEFHHETQRDNKGVREIRHPSFNLNIDIIQDDVDFQFAKRFKPPLVISVHVDGPTKVVTFADAPPEVGEPPKIGGTRTDEEEFTPSKSKAPPIRGMKQIEAESKPTEVAQSRTLDVKLWVKSIGLSFIDKTPMELAYLLISGIQFRLDRFDGQQLVVCEVQDLQLDNQLPQAAWPVAIWSPVHEIPPQTPTTTGSPSGISHMRPNERKPFFEVTIDGQYPSIKDRIGYFRGIYVALQQIQVNADEDFVYRGLDFVNSLLSVTGGSNTCMTENLAPKDGEELDMSKLITDSIEESNSNDKAASKTGAMISRLYVTNLELCPVKVTVSFIPSRSSSTTVRRRSSVRTLVAVLGNVQNAEFRFNALELQHVFDSVGHFRSLIAEFYIAQCSTQKFTLLTSNSLIGNPSALFDSIAIGAKDFFYEPAKAKGSADFIVSIGRGSSSLLTNTVGGLIGSVGEIPRAVAHGLETAVGDKEYLAERESIRGGRARAVTTPAQGLVNGALSFGHGIASGAAGLIKDPVQGAVEEGASGFMKGLRKGVIGGVLKPITGALDLIAEPAAGFRNFMVSDRNKGFAEPNRPFRTFLGARRDRLSLYDFSLSLGNNILQCINGTDAGTEVERLVAWVDFTPTCPVLENESVDAFLWALIRKSTRNPNAGRGTLVDVHGGTQRADKLRVGLITSRRVLVSTLSGNTIIWEHPLADVVGTQASVESKNYLSIGIRPVGSNNHAVPPTWEKIHCGTYAAREAFNTALRKVLADFGLTRARQQGVFANEAMASFK